MSLVIAIIGSDVALVGQVLTALQNSEDSKPFIGWDEVLRDLARFKAVILVASALDAGDLQRLAALRKVRPLLLLVAVSYPTSSNFRLFETQPRQDLEAFWSDELDRLQSVLSIYFAQDPVLRFINVLGRLELSKHTAKALELIASAPESRPRTLKGIARELSRTKRTLERHWAADIPPQVTPRRLMEWRRLFDFLPLTAKVGAAQAATILRCDLRTVERSAERLTRHTLQECIRDPALVTTAFEAWAGSAICDQDRRDPPSHLGSDGVAGMP